MQAQGKKFKPGRRHFLGRGLLPRMAIAMPVTLALGITGCAGSKSVVGADPLLGKSANAQPISQNTPKRPSGTEASLTSQPLPPAPSGTASTTALAQGVSQPLDSRYNLGMGTPGENRSWAGLTTAGNTSLSRPEPVTGLVPPPDRSAARALESTTGSRLRSFEDAQALLRDRGITWQRLESAADQGGWKFSCSIPNRQNPKVSRTYEAQARTELDAIQAVLDQIDKER
jgi:hypothetical protein